MSPERLAFSDLRSVGGYALDELASWIQKAVRRGDEEGALFAVSELDVSGYGEYAWSRLATICAEDVGLASPETFVLVHSLREAWAAQRKRDKAAKRDGPTSAVLFLSFAVLAMCRSPKSRLVDHACGAAYATPRPVMTVPDYALDHHTTAGRQMGRTEEKAYAESYWLENRAELDDPYFEARVAAGEPGPTSLQERLDLD